MGSGRAVLLMLFGAIFLTLGATAGGQEAIRNIQLRESGVIVPATVVRVTSENSEGRALAARVRWQIESISYEGSLRDSEQFDAIAAAGVPLVGAQVQVMAVPDRPEAVGPPRSPDLVLAVAPFLGGCLPGAAMLTGGYVFWRRARRSEWLSTLPAPAA